MMILKLNFQDYILDLVRLIKQNQFKIKSEVEFKLKNKLEKTIVSKIRQQFNKILYNIILELNHIANNWFLLLGEVTL